MGPEVDAGILEEMKLYKKFGGGTVVENTSIGLGRNIPLLVKASKESDVNVIAGTGKEVFNYILNVKLNNLLRNIFC